MRKGELTRAAILDVALDLASRNGLEGLTIGLLADKMNMSKSGVFAHFGSREDLQMEVLKLYHHRFEQEVFFPSVKEARGIARLTSMFALDPARVHRRQSCNAACFLHTGEKHFLLEAVVIQLEHFHLQVFARTEMREHARLTHVHLVGEKTDGQAFQTFAAGKVKCDVKDGGPGELALAHEFG